MSDRTTTSRGDRRRNARLELFRRLLPPEFAVVAIDLAAAKQAIVVADHDSRVLGRRTVYCRPDGLSAHLQWAHQVAVDAGFSGVLIACEPTGHRWKAVGELAAARNESFVCVQPMLVRRAREAEDLTNDKSDDKDAMIIARLVTELHFYIPEPPDLLWSRLRHLGARRAQLVEAGAAARQQVRDLLDEAWPAALGAAAAPFRSYTWLAGMLAVDCDRALIAGLDLAEFTRLAVLTRDVRYGVRRVDVT